MIFKLWKNESGDGCISEIMHLKDAVVRADAIVIGAGAGLSAAAGFTYSGSRFKEYFSDFEKKYDFHDMYSGGFYPYGSAEEKWAFWSRYIYINRYMDPPEPVYNELYELVRDRDYFVITTNVDHCFQKAGFKKDRLFYTQGDYGLFQCSVPCHAKTYDNEETIKLMLKYQKDMKIPKDMVPRCPLCGRPMKMNLREDDTFVEDEGWKQAAERYAGFMHSRSNKRVLFMELGVGYNTPAIIKYPFWRMTALNKKATYACINNGEALVLPEIEKQSICINEDIALVMKDLAGQSAW